MDQVATAVGLAAAAGAAAGASGIVIKDASKTVFSLLLEIGKPTAVQLGQQLADELTPWKADNLKRIQQFFRRFMESRSPDADYHLHPRIAYKVIEQGAWTDDELMQEMWGGMLASSTTTSVATDRNLVLLNTLEKMTPAQVKLLNNVVDRFWLEHPGKDRGQIMLSGEQVREATGVEDLDDFNSEYYNMTELGVLDEWMIYAGNKANLSWLLKDNKKVATSPSRKGMEIVLRGRGIQSSLEKYLAEMVSHDNEEPTRTVGLS